jgi:hypothetical protein
VTYYSLVLSRKWLYIEFFPNHNLLRVQNKEERLKVIMLNLRTEIIMYNTVTLFLSSLYCNVKFNNPVSVIICL